MPTLSIQTYNLLYLCVACAVSTVLLQENVKSGQHGTLVEENLIL